MGEDQAAGFGASQEEGQEAEQALCGMRPEVR